MYSSSYAPVIKPGELKSLLCQVPCGFVSNGSGDVVLTDERMMFLAFVRAEQAIKAMLNADAHAPRLNWSQADNRIDPSSPKASMAKANARRAPQAGMKAINAALRLIHKFQRHLCVSPFTQQVNTSDETNTLWLNLSPALWVAKLLLDRFIGIEMFIPRNESQLRTEFESLCKELRGQPGPKAAKTPFQQASTVAQNRLSRRKKSGKALLTQLERNSGRTTAVPIVLAYRLAPDSDPSLPALSSVKAHLEHVLIMRQNYKHLSMAVGYVWHILYTPLLGPHVRIMWLWNEAFEPSVLPAVLAETQALWTQVVEGQSYTLQEFVFSAMSSSTEGQIYSSDVKSEWEAMRGRLEYWAILDHFVSIIMPDKKHTFGRSNGVRKRRSR